MFQVPLGDKDRLNRLPSLCGREFVVTNETSFKQTTADIQLSSLGKLVNMSLVGRKHYENTPMRYTAIFRGCKNNNFQLNVFDYFHIFAQTYIVGTH